MCARKTTHKKRSKRRKKSSKPHYKQVWIIILFLVVCIVLSILWVESEYRSPRDNSVFRTKHSTAQKYSAEGLETPCFLDKKYQQIIKHTGFTVSYSESHRLPYWVGYELTVDKLYGEHNRTDRFVPDPKIQCIQAHTNDYTRSGYDRGHMAPAADMKWDRNAMAESFYLSNICPQHPELNRRAWKILEERVRDWTQSDSLLIVVCGPLLNDACTRIGRNKVSIPDGFFKVILSPFASPPQAIGFLFKNTHSTKPLSEYAVSVDSVERVCGLDFFHQLPDSTEHLVESFLDKIYWGLD